MRILEAPAHQIGMACGMIRHRSGANAEAHEPDRAVPSHRRIVSTMVTVEPAAIAVYGRGPHGS